MFDLEMIKAVYARMDERIAAARKVVNRPLTLTEKILYSHLTAGNAAAAYNRGKDYVDFNPDRVAMQDATAQMALLQFMQAGRPKVAVPSTVHCDHLITAKNGAAEDLEFANKESKEAIVFVSEISDILYSASVSNISRQISSASSKLSIIVDMLNPCFIKS